MGVIRLAIDALGGDFAPQEIVAGALAGARHLGIQIRLVGDPAAIQPYLDEAATAGLDLAVIPARGVIRMEAEPARAVRAQPEASINVACRLVLEGQADGVLTMGHTGAGMIAALFHFGRIPGVERPAAIVPLLGLRSDLFLIDAGANTEVRPQHLLQFARMGSAYLEHAIGLPRPRVGLLSNGAEANKGNAVGREAYGLLAGTTDLNFVGNVEGDQLLAGAAHLIVADGFTGNILLKSAEGLVAGLLEQVAEVLPQLEPESAEVVQAHLELLRARNHYSRHGAAALLGVQHPMFIGHGRSRAEAVINGMATAQRAIAGDVTGIIRQAFARSQG
jgi:glycerol-3-phosphate acyltransferase PlsX